ncbi:Fe2+-enterobactin ABC transporter substrate-binding protein [Roseovarius sp. M141]|uniref:Fe2+-enterobactin ABC transporter substrate-binding protein n=1 Tax=Roseovarius sp. M141 TaxID=2583806 RepID=UPI0020CFD5B1|nr:Fe2+-enterobactin ABC transporter substrate-binding protein [Roseovarius sp. M141]MCQ0091957.1 Fe2+-enterobactin ABC transporter substrate-binding protein [Roseovarius sp. M141]
MKLLLPLLLLATPLVAEESWPRQIDHATGTLTLDAPPQRIVSTSPSLTGTLLAIDAPLLATASAVAGQLSDDSGFFNQWAETAHERGVEPLYRDFNFDIEALMIADPDLVVVSETGGDSVLPFVGEIEALGYPVITLNYGVNSWEQIAAKLGRATGHEAQAEKITQDFRLAAHATADKIRHPEGSVSIVSYNFFGSYGVSKPISAHARVLAEMGFTVTGIPAELAGAVQQSREFDFISHENLPAAITGDSVFLLAADDEDVATFMADPVLANVSAVREGRVYVLGPTSFRIDYYSGLAMIDTVAAQLAK